MTHFLINEEWCLNDDDVDYVFSVVFYFPTNLTTKTAPNFRNPCKEALTRQPTAVRTAVAVLAAAAATAMDPVTRPTPVTPASLLGARAARSSLKTLQILKLSKKRRMKRKKTGVIIPRKAVGAQTYRAGNWNHKQAFVWEIRKGRQRGAVQITGRERTMFLTRTL